MNIYCRYLLTSFIFALFIVCPAKNAFSQQSLTIKGNIKILKNNERDIDQCCFWYTDMLSGKRIIIPISRDSVGNYSITISLENYQQFNFSKAINLNGNLFYNYGFTMFSFFGKPGLSMELNYTEATGLLNFKGDLSKENQQYQQYYKAQQNGVKNIWEVPKDHKMFPDEIKKLTLTSYKEQLDFNRKYFAKHPAATFVKQQAYYSTLYQTQNAAIQFNLISGNKVTATMLTDLYKAMNTTGGAYKDGPGTLAFVTDPNPSLKNPGAVGNSDYKALMSSYFKVLEDNMPVETVQKISAAELAGYALNKYPNLSDLDKKVLAKTLDTTEKLSNDDEKRIHSMMTLYHKEILAIREDQTQLENYLKIEDPALRDIGATMSLFKKLNLNQIDHLAPILPLYQKEVKNTYLKNKFITAYNAEMNKLHQSILSPAAIINSSEDLKGPALLAKMLEKYKGKVVYIDIWATWCGPCLAAMEPSLKLQEKLKGSNVVFLYICINSPDITGWKNVIAAKQMKGENYFFDHAQSAIIGKELNISTIPHYAIIDKNGSIVIKNAPSPFEPETSDQIIGLAKK